MFTNQNGFKKFLSLALVLSIILSQTACSSTPPTPVLSDPTSQIVTENIEIENIETETIITETVLTEFITSEIYLEEIVVAENKISELLLEEETISEVILCKTIYVPQNNIEEFAKNSQTAQLFGDGVDILPLLAKVSLGTGVIITLTVLDLNLKKGPVASIVAAAADESLKFGETGAMLGSLFGGLTGVANEIDESGRLSAVIGFAIATVGMIKTIISLIAIVPSGGSTTITAAAGIKLVIAGVHVLAATAGTTYAGYQTIKAFTATDASEIDWNNIDWEQVGVSSAEKAIENAADGYMWGAIIGAVDGGAKGYDDYQKSNALYTQKQDRINQTPNSIRTINRLCNAVQFKLSSISTEVDFADIVAISALEIQHPEVYEWIKENRALLTGGFDLYSIREMNKTQKELKDFYTAQIEALLQKNGQSTVTDEQVDVIIAFLSHLFPNFGQKIGEIYEIYDLNLFRKNNQIAHPEKCDRYFSLDLEEVTIKKSEILNAIFESDCETLVKTLLEKEADGDSYEFLEEIRALTSDILADRAETIVTALLIASSYLDTPSQKNFLSLPASALAEHMVIELLDIIDPSNRFQFISDILSNSSLPVLQTLASIINMLELAYGRLAANGEERKYKKVITLEELMKVESIFVERVKQVLTEHSLFDFEKWRIVCYLMECFAPDYTKTYLEGVLKEDSNIAQYLSDSVAIWTGAGTEYEITDAYKKHLTQERVLQAIESLKRSGALFSMPENIQKKCCAFFINATTEEKDYREKMLGATVDKLLTSWRQ